MPNETLQLTAELPRPQGPEILQPYSTRDITKFIIYSFRFSQGQPEIQDEIYNYIHANYKDRLDPNVIDGALPEAIDAVERIVGNPKLHKQIENDSRTAIREEVMQNIDFLKNGLGHPPNLLRMGQKIIHRDRKFLVSGNDPDLDISDPLERSSGRPRSTEDQRVTPNTDPFISQFVYYGLMGQTTGSPEFDAMFHDMVEAVEASTSLADIGDIDELAAAQIRHHPEQIELLPADVREQLDHSLV